MQANGRRCGYMVPMGQSICEVCTNMPPAHISCPPGTNWSKGPKGFKPPKGGGKGSGAPTRTAADAKKIKDLEWQLGKAREELKGAKKPQPSATMQHGEGNGSESTSKSDADKSAVKATQKRMANVKDMEPGIRDEFCEKYGGYEAYMQKLEKQLQEEWAQQRGQKPLAQQKASADAHLNRMQKAKEVDDTKLEDIQRQLEQLAKDAESQKAKCQEAEAKVQKAKDEVLAIREKETAELRGPESPSTEGAATGVANLARVVEGFVQNLPPSAAAQATQAAEQLMAIAGSVGQRPLGTQEACADMAMQGLALQEKMYTEADVHKMLECVVDDMDVESDEESEAPTEGGEEGKELKKARKAEKLKAKAAKREKLKDSSWTRIKVMAKIGKS